ncbi:MAG: AlpA family phage regulatory protein [Desulfovibrio sp.]|nr:AlpA family phage regulatory protein [Desulfovibrio sp.]
MSDQRQNLLPETGFIRLKTVLELIPVGTTAWYEGVKSGRFPKPISIGPRVRAYRVSDIQALIEKLNAQVEGGIKNEK